MSCLGCLGECAAKTPRRLRFICPFASRPWPKRDLEKAEKNGVPYLNVKGYVDFHEGDPEDPRNWSKARSWYISLVSIFLVLNGTIASSIISGVATSISTEFGVSEVATNLNSTLFLLGYCAGPFIFAPLSEFYGRRWLTIGTFLAYMAFNILCAFAPNFGSLLVGRALAGTFVSAPLCTSPGLLADLWKPLDRSGAMALFAVAVWAGPSIGPVVAAFLDEAKGWRWAFYFLLMMGAAAVLVMLTIPETHAPTILVEKANRHRQTRIAGFAEVKTETEDNDRALFDTYKVALLRPWVLLFDLISFLSAIYMGVVFMLQFMLFSIYPMVFQDIRGWTAAVAQLPLLGSVVGAFIAAAIMYNDKRHRQKIYDEVGYLEPEEQLKPARAGGIGFAVFMFCFAWTAPFASIHWMVPTLAGTLLSTSLMLVFVAMVNYMVDSYGQYAASIVAVNTVARSLGSAAAPLFTNFMFQAMQVGGGGSLIGGAATVLAVIPFVFCKYGKQIRMRSKYTEAVMAEDPKRAAGEEHPTSYEGVTAA